MEVVIDVNDLTLGEVEEIENLTGLTVGDFGDGTKMSAKLVTAFVYISKRRTDPDFTIEDARKIKLGEFQPVARPTKKAASTSS